MASYTTTDLINSVKRGITIPNFQALITDADILLFANEEMRSVVLDVITSLRQDFFSTLVEVNIVADQDAYDIPYRAIGRGLRDIKYRTDPGNQIIRDLAWTEIQDSHLFGALTGEPRAFYFLGDQIKILPKPASSQGQLMMYYNMRPSKFVVPADAAQIVSIDTVGNTVTLNRLPTSVVTGGAVDFIKDRSGNSIISFDQTVTNVAGFVLSFTALPSGILVNDWVSLAETSPVIALPDEVTQFLAQCVMCRVLEAIGDTEGFKVSKSRLDEKLKSVRNVLVPRIEGENQKVVNRQGLLRSRSYFQLYRRRFF